MPRFKFLFSALFLVPFGLVALTPQGLMEKGYRYNIGSLSRVAKNYNAEFRAEVEIERPKSISVHVIGNFDLGALELDNDAPPHLKNNSVYNPVGTLNSGFLLVEKVEDDSSFHVRIKRTVLVSEVGSKDDSEEDLFKGSMTFHEPQLLPIGSLYKLTAMKEGKDGFDFKFEKNKEASSSAKGLVFGSRRQVMIRFGDRRMVSSVPLPQDSSFRGTMELEVRPAG